MKICFLVDARSPIAQNWIMHFIWAGHEVHIISTYYVNTDVLSTAFLQVVPVAFSGFVKEVAGLGEKGDEKSRRSSSTLRFKALRGGKMASLLVWIRHWAGPFDVFRHGRIVRDIIQEINPDLVHAMRIPYEGMLAAEALRNVRIPLLVSVWGNDFTLFASKFPVMAWMTRRAIARADALHTDCRRDFQLAQAWGFDIDKPAIVVPGSGGIQPEVFHNGGTAGGWKSRLAIGEGAHVVLNPRGFRGYVRNDTFFRSIPLVLEQRPNTVFLGLAMEGNPIAERWIRDLGVKEAVRLLPAVERKDMADLFRLADALVSPSEHDGTPNTLLEAMACGCFPVAGDIESVREWIEDGNNGLLCDPASPKALAQAILRALNDGKLRKRAQEYNLKMIAERAEYGRVMACAEQFYQQIVDFTLSRGQF